MVKSTLLMGFVGLSALALTAVTTNANAQDKVRWKMQSAFGGQLPHCCNCAAASSAQFRFAAGLAGLG